MIQSSGKCEGSVYLIIRIFVEHIVNFMKRLAFLVVLPLLLFSGCGQNSGKSNENEAPKVKVFNASARSCDVPYSYPAQLKGKRDISIYPQVNGTLTEVYVIEGQNVKKGQKLFAIDATPYQAAVDNAKAAVLMAKANVQTQELELDATKQLFDKGIVSEHQYKVETNTLMIAKASLAEVEARLKRAENDLNHTLICSPHDGVVGSINYRQGSLVAPSIEEPLTIVSDNSTIYAYISIDADNYMELLREAGSKEAMLEQIPEAVLKLGDGADYEEKGRVETISGIIDNFTGAISVRVAFPNPDLILSAGGSGTVVITYNYEGIVIPRSATYEMQDKHFAFKAVKQEDGTVQAKSCEIEVYRLNDSEYIVAEGISAGDRIVAEGVKKLTEGTVITPVEE